MFAFLFSFKGRIRPLQFFLGSIGITFVPLILFVFAFFAIGVASLNDVTGRLSNEAGLGFLVVLGLGFLVWVVVAVWGGLALMVKRSRDAGLPSWFRWTYALSMTVFQFVPVVNIAAYLFNFVSWWVLVLKQPVPHADDIDVGAFGDAPAANLANMDLVARAAAIRAEAPVSALPTPTPIAAPVARAGAAPRGFGRRTQPAFGKR